MTSAHDSTAPPRHRRRYLTRSLLVLLGVVVVGAVWVLATGLLARHNAGELRRNLAALKSDLAAGRETAAAQRVHQMQQQAAAAHARTSGPAWWVASQVPGLGGPLRAVRKETALLDDVAATALPPALRAGQALDPTRLRTGPDSIDLERLAAAGQPLEAAAGATGSFLRRAQQLPSGGWLPPARHGRAELTGVLTTLHRALSDLATATRLLPGPLGATGTRRYFVAFENDAEARGIGGLPGSFAILTASHGRLRFSHFGNDDVLIGTKAKLDLGRDFRRFYSVDYDFDPTADIRNSDRSPHFPYAAQIWMSMWQAKFGQRLDGAIATDPTALSYLLGAVGQVTLSDGSIVNADDAVRFFESAVYAEFPPSQTKARKGYETAAAEAVVSQVLHQPGHDLLATGSALQRAADEGRLLVYTSDPAVQSTLAATPLSGSVPVTPRPYLGVVVNNTSGTKLDYYLDRDVTYTRNSCAAGRATVTVRLHNAAPASGLPPYVTATGAPYAPRTPGENDMVVSLFSTAGSSVNTARLNGKTAFITTDSERGHPVTSTSVSLKPGATSTLVFTVHEPAAAGRLVSYRQPLVRPLVQHIQAPAACG